MAYDNRKAFVKESDSDYYTDAVSHTKISVLDSFDSTQKNNYYYSYGDTHVYTQVVGFKKIKFFTNENIGAGDLQLPQQEMHTTSFWLTIKRELLDGIEISTEEKVEAVAGIAYLMRHIAAVFLMCDTNDIGYAVEDNITKSDIHINGIKKKVVKTDISPTNDLVEFEPNIYIYDNYPNGIGFSEMLYEKIEEILNQTIQVIETCECKDGCPSCIGPPIKRDSKTKLAAKFILNSLLGKIYN
jgi:DEAD/DEAH box helicase domain-containing protein